MGGAGEIQGRWSWPGPLFFWRKWGLPAQLLAPLVGLDKPLAPLGLTMAFVKGEIILPSILHIKRLLNAITARPASLSLAQALRHPFSFALAPAHGRLMHVHRYLHFSDKEAHVQR